MISHLRIHLLGDFLLTTDGTPVPLLPTRVQSLLAYLLLHREAPQDRSRLAFLLWPDSTEAQAHTNLRKLLHQLRQSFPELERFLQIDNHSLQWLPADAEHRWTLDLREMEQALERANQAEKAQRIDEARQELEQAVQLYRGDLLPGSYDEWLLAERDHWRERFLQAAQRLSTLLEQERDFEAAITVAQRLLRHDPLHETTYCQLMRLHALHGDRSAALRVYHTCATTLERELGTQPGKTTRKAYEALLQADNTPGAPGELGTALPLLGRQTAWRELQEAWRQATTGQPRMVLLTGEAGIGKTRLAEEMAAWVSRQGMASASARCYAALGQLAYAPVTGWLRCDAVQSNLPTLDPAWLTELARLLPELLSKQPELARPSALSENWQRQQFFEALARAIHAARQPLLLLIDDLHWCDRETLEWLHYLMRFDAGARLLLIGTVRSEEMQPDHPLLTLLNALQRDNLIREIAPGPLNAAEVTALAEHILGRQLDSAYSAALYAETEGNPLFVVEMARARTLEQARSSTSEANRTLPLLTQPTSTLPPALQTVLGARLSQLSPLAQEVAHVAAAIGREFTFAVLLQASGEPEEEIVRGLDELWQRRLVREQGAGLSETYDFSHDKLRELVYVSLSPAHRRLLHRHIAEAFKVVYANDLERVSGQIAAHYEYAGQPVQAIPYYQQAGDAARQIYAHAEAIHAFERAAVLLAALPQTQFQQEKRWQSAARTQETLGDIFLETGRCDEARQALQRAQAFLPEHEILWRAGLQRKIARAWNYVSNSPQDAFHANARAAFQQAEQLLRNIWQPADSAWRQEWIDLHFAQIWPLRGTADDMTSALDKVRPIIAEYGSEAQRKLLVDATHMRNAVRSRFTTSEAAITDRRQALAEALLTGDKGQIGTAEMVLGILLIWTNELDEAEEHLTKALQVGEQAGIAWLQTRCLTFLPFIFRKRGQVEQVRALLVRAHSSGADQNNNVLLGHRAWIAWRDGNLAEAESYGQASLASGHNQAEINPFQWAGSWPLLGVALAQENIAAARELVRALLSPHQQDQPAPLKALLASALQAWDDQHSQTAREHLQQAIPLATNLGYL